MRPALCIVVPVLDEAPALADRLRALETFRRRGARVVVVDGGSRDDTLAIALEHADLALRAPRGRASQMNAGAAACPADVLLFLALRETARQRLFAAVGWLGPQLHALVEHYARDITIDITALEEAIESQLSSAMSADDLERAGQALAGKLFEPAITAEQAEVLERLETLLALVEGWVDEVVGHTMSRWMPNGAALTEIVRRRRAAGGPAESALKSLVGLELRPRRTRDAANLWAAVRATGCPVAWTERNGGHWVITGYDEGGDVLIGWNFFQNMPPFQAGVEFDPSGQLRKRDWFDYPPGLSLIIPGQKQTQPPLPDTYLCLTEVLPPGPQPSIRLPQRFDRLRSGQPASTRSVSRSS